MRLWLALVLWCGCGRGDASSLSFQLGIRCAGTTGLIQGHVLWLDHPLPRGSAILVIWKFVPKRGSVEQKLANHQERFQPIGIGWF